MKTIDTRPVKHATFIGNSLDNLHVRDLNEARFRKLMIPENPEFYTVEQREIVDVDDLFELVVNFTTDLSVTVEYGDMVIGHIGKISVMPDIDGDGGYIQFYDENDIEISMIVPEKERFCLFIPSVTVEDDLMLFVKVELKYFETPHGKYPYVWLEKFYEDEKDIYQLQAKLSPLQLQPIILKEYTLEDMTCFDEHVAALRGVPNNVELAVLPYSSFVIDNSYNCYRIDKLDHIFIELTDIMKEDDGDDDIDSVEHLRVPYTELFNFEKEYTFKHYIDSEMFVIYSDELTINIINNEPDSVRDHMHIEDVFAQYCERICCPRECMPVDESYDAFLKEAKLDSCVIIDAEHQYVLLLDGKNHNYTRIL